MNLGDGAARGEELARSRIAQEWRIACGHRRRIARLPYEERVRDRVLDMTARTTVEDAREEDVGRDADRLPADVADARAHVVIREGARVIGGSVPPEW